MKFQLKDKFLHQFCRKGMVSHAVDKLFLWIAEGRQDLVRILQQASHKGLLNNDSLTMIEGVFQVSDMCVRDIMLPRPQMKVIRKDADFDEVQRSVVESAHSRFPVIGDDPDSIEGILLAKDLLPYFDSKERENFRIRNLLRQPYIVPESKRLSVLLEEFRRSRNHMAIVVDEYGGVAGLVTIEDVLEQIVGDITDEHDVAEDQYIHDHGENQYKVKALMPVSDFNEYFGCHLDDRGIADTIGGLIISVLGHLPKDGEMVKIDAFTFKVHRADTRRIHSLMVSK